jgi:uncharacterized protein YggE
MFKWLAIPSVIVALAAAGFTIVTLRADQPEGKVADSDGKRTLSVSGTAKVRVKPDAVRLFFGVVTINPSVKEARAENEARVQRVLEAVNNLGIPDLKTKTTDVNYSLIQSRSPREDVLPKILGYRVTHTFTVLISHSEPERLANYASQVLEAALEHGVNQVGGVQFFRQNDSEARREALLRAVQDAEANAQTMAKGINVPLKGPVTVNMASTYRPHFDVQVYNAPIMARDGGDVTVMPGEVEISCTVSVTYSF